MAKELMASQPVNSGLRKIEGGGKREPRRERRKQRINERRKRKTGSWPGRDARGNSKRRRTVGDTKDGNKERSTLIRLETSARRVGRETLFLAFYSRDNTHSNLLRVDQKQGRRKRRRKRRAHSPHRSLYRGTLYLVKDRLTCRKGKVYKNPHKTLLWTRVKE